VLALLGPGFRRRPVMRDCGATRGAARLLARRFEVRCKRYDVYEGRSFRRRLVMRDYGATRGGRLLA
jgi:hypothetical protein